MSADPSQKKPLSPWVWGCSGCSIIVLILLAAGTYAGVKLNDKLAEEVSERADAADARAVSRVPGGIVRVGATGGDWASVMGVAFRTRDEVTYTAFEMPSFGKIMGSGGGAMVMPFWDEEAMARQGAKMTGKMFDSALRGCDLSDGSTRVVADVPENMMAGEGGPVWNAQGTVAIAELIAFDALFETDSSLTSEALYTMEPGAGGEWTKLTLGLRPRWSPDGEWIAFSRSSASQTTVWCIRSDGSGERQLLGRGGRVLGWDETDGVCTAVFLQVWNDDEPVAAEPEPTPMPVAAERKPVPAAAEPERRAFSGDLLRIPLTGGETTQVAITDTGERFGPLSPHERVFADYGGGDGGDGTGGECTYFGVIDITTGRVRWLGSGVTGSWACEAILLGHRGILARPCYGSSGRGGVPMDDQCEAAPHEADEDDDSGCSTCCGSTQARPEEPDAEPWGVVSALDGKLRHTAAMRGTPVTTADGQRVAWVNQREGAYMTFLPMPIEDIAVFDILYPDELLTGPADVQPYSGPGKARVGPMR